MNEEQRRYTRVPFLRKARIQCDEQLLGVYCLQLSLHGLLLTQPEQPLIWQPGQRLDVELLLTDQQCIRMECRLVHLCDEVLGCCIERLGLEDLARLFRVLSFNLPDRCAVDAELRQRIDENRRHAWVMTSH